MNGEVLCDGDLALFEPVFGSAVVAVRPGTLRASGMDKVNGKRVCVVGDEMSVQVPGCPYTTPAHGIPGIGILSIAALGGDQAGAVTKGGFKLMVKGTRFQARFTVTMPAMQVLGGTGAPIPDSTPQYLGFGSFQNFVAVLRLP